MNIRRLHAADVEAFQALRLAALLDTPESFPSSHEEEKDLPLSTVADRFDERPGTGVFGAFDGDTLVGMIGLGRNVRAKLAHKGRIWGMYVAPSVRRFGVARQLVLAALALARGTPGMSKVVLHVEASNVAAIALYESLGFVVFAREADAMRLGDQKRDELQMALQLGAPPPEKPLPI